jgi:polyhydroxyalkanoate synthesis regulator protein
MTEWDKMYIKIYNIKNAEIYLAKGKGYIWLDHLDQMVQDDDVFDTELDW